MSLFALGYLLTISFLHGCKNVDKLEGKAVFAYNEDAGINGLDPAFARSQAEIWIVGQLYNTLVELDSQLRPAPSLAKHWETSADGKTWRFHLRSGVPFHPHRLWQSDAERRVRASDIVFSLQRIADPAIASPGAWVLNDKIDTTLGKEWIRALNDSTVELRLRSRFPQLLSQLAMNYAMVVPEKLLQRGLNLKTDPVGSGPFRFARWVPDVRLVMLKNDSYWERDGKGKALPYLHAINVDMLRNKQTAFMKFLSGDYAFFNGIDAQIKDDLLTRDGQLSPRYRNRFRLLSQPFLNTEYLGFYLGEAQASHPIQNVHLRKALALSIDRAALVKFLRNGLGDPGIHGFVPPVLLPEPVQGYGFDLKMAAAEMELAGFAGGKGLQELEINTTADYADMAVFIQQAWKQIGVKAKISVHPGGHLRQLRNKGAIALFRGSWIADYADAENYLSCFISANKSPNGPNYTHYSGTEFDAGYTQAMELPDSLRGLTYARMDARMMEQAPLIVLYYDHSVRLIANHVEGLGNNPMNQLVLKRVRLNQKAKE